MYFWYKLFTYLFYPFAPIYLYFRKLRKKEDPIRYKEKLSKIKGITKAEVGYCGGNNSKTSYKEVCTGQTNHAEVVKIEFDEKVITYDEIVNFFFKIHDPTTFNRQGPDIGSQYRSEIFFCDEEQKKIAEKVNQNLNNKFFINQIVNKLIKNNTFSKDLFFKKIVKFSKSNSFFKYI